MANSITVPIHQFGNGMANDYSNGGAGEFSVSKQFDILTFPNRLQPVRGGMTAETLTTSLIGNIIGAKGGGAFYAVGVDYPSNPTKGQLYWRNGFSVSPSYTATPTNAQLSGQTVRLGDYNFLVEFPDAGQSRTVYWASTNILVASDPTGASSAATSALTFSTISQGFVHPSDNKLYFGYQTATQTLLGIIAPNGAAFGGLTTGIDIGIPSRYKVTSITNYGDFLAIALSSPATGGASQSLVVLWDRDTSLKTVSQVILWGGDLQVLNNLSGILVGVSSKISSVDKTSTTTQDALQIKVWAGGSESEPVKEIPALVLTATQPSVIVHPTVNFIYNNRLYFSADVVSGGSALAYYGLWSVGKNQAGHWALTIERMATDTSTEISVLAAGLTGDFLSICHTALGTLTYTAANIGMSFAFRSTSVYESCINPDMGVLDKEKDKKLMTVYATYLPIPATGQVVMKYRVDSTQDEMSGTLGNGWTTCFTTTSGVSTEMVIDANGSQFTSGRKYEFRLESTGGAIITGWGYKYLVLSTNI